MSEEEGKRDRGRLRANQLDGDKKAWNSGSLELRDAKVKCIAIVSSRRDLVNGT